MAFTSLRGSETASVDYAVTKQMRGLQGSAVSKQVRVTAFQPIREGQTVRGKLLGSAQLASGRFAMIQTPQHGVSSAADLKFLHHLQQTLLGTSNRKRH